DTIVGGVRVERSVRVAVAKFGEGVTLPHFVLAAVVDERRIAVTLDETGEGSARLDLRQLARVADEDDFGAGVVCVLDESEELPGADHAGLVDREDVVRLEWIAIEGSEKPVDGCGRNAR